MCRDSSTVSVELLGRLEEGEPLDASGSNRGEMEQDVTDPASSDIAAVGVSDGPESSCEMYHILVNINIIKYNNTIFCIAGNSSIMEVISHYFIIH